MTEGDTMAAWGRMHRLVSLGVVVLVSLAHGAGCNKAGDSPSAQEILANMLQAYSTCSSYRDTGTVKDLAPDGTEAEAVAAKFATTFIRGSYFRFEYNIRGSGLSFVESDSKGIRSFLAGVGAEEEESLNLAVAGATGVSQGSAHTVPVLLMPDQLTGLSLREATDLTLKGEENLDGVTCYVLEGQWGREPVSIWIDKETGLLRRLQERGQFSEQTDYRPEVNVAIPLAENEAVADQ